MSHRNHRFDPIVIDDDDDEDDEAGGMQVDFSHQQRQRGMFGYDTPDHIRGSPSIYHTSIEQEKKVRSRLREERHAALSVLMDRELLMVQALAAQETLPQTRRRFLTKLIAPEDPDIAASIRADRFIIQAQPQYSASSSSSSNTVPVPVCRNIVDVCETDDAGWMKPKPKTREMASSSPVGGGASGSVSMSSSAKSGKSNSRTPDRGRMGKARASSSRHHHHNQQQNRERDRRRRWSGAERDDGGFAVQRFSP